MGRKLLVADDSVTIQKVIKLALSSEGYDILTVSEGKEAIRAIQEERPDVVLIDVTLPGADAFAVKRAANADPKLAATGFILMLSAFERVDEEAIDSVKFQGRLIKPFDPSHLRKAVAEVLAGKGSAPAAVVAAPPPPVTTGPTKLASALDDLPPVHDMHPTIPDEPPETLTEEEFQVESPVEVTRLSLEPALAKEDPPRVFSMPSLTAATFDSNAMSPAGGPPAEVPPPPPPSPAETEIEEKTDPNFRLPDEAVSRSIENDIKNLTESTIKMSGLDEWSLDDSKKMKAPVAGGKSPESPPVRVLAPPPAAPSPPVRPPGPSVGEHTRETTSPSIDKRAAILRGLMSPPSHPIDDGGTTFAVGSPSKFPKQPKREPGEPMMARPTEPKVPDITGDIGLGREYVGPTAPPPAILMPEPSKPNLIMPEPSKPNILAPDPSRTNIRAESIFSPSALPPQAALPISRAEIEQLIRKDFEAAIEKLARETFPKIAEQIIRQEIEKLLAEP